MAPQRWPHGLEGEHLMSFRGGRESSPGMAAAPWLSVSVLHCIHLAEDWVLFTDRKRGAELAPIVDVGVQHSLTGGEVKPFHTLWLNTEALCGGVGGARKGWRVTWGEMGPTLGEETGDAECWWWRRKAWGLLASARASPGGPTARTGSGQSWGIKFSLSSSCGLSGAESGASGVCSSSSRGVWPSAIC